MNKMKYYSKNSNSNKIIEEKRKVKFNNIILYVFFLNFDV